ncbi:MAG TPA: hypothetical protein VHH35_20765, partial [Pyrinomonadaceae bacterium]|nr:hypothetical protein [Pyrinomonadaceae bacterium]
VGAAAGSAIGDQVEEELGEGVPHEDLFVYEDAIRHGRSIVIANVPDDQGDRAREIVRNAGAEDIDTLREHWWNEVRAEERAYYQRDGRDFDRDEATYRRGFQAALHPHRRGKSYTEVEDDLRTSYGPELDTCFRDGYERGQVYCSKYGERRTD